MYWTGISSSHPKPTAELWQNPSSEEHCQNPAPVPSHLFQLTLLLP